MSSLSGATERRSGKESLEPILEHWKQRLLELPAVRVDKVRSVREAIGRGTYESERALECILQELSNELGVFCLEDSKNGSV